MAAMAAFLASDDGAYCTGQAMNVTGGMVMH
jgi:NAD(P)-dependent dehydrogenase (short-subunit alcohol dehydrogenase family)